MSSALARLIRTLLKRLCQVLAALTTSSTQRLRIFLSFFRHFVSKICGLLKLSADSNPSASESYIALTSTSSAWCSRATLPLALPLHNGHITLESVASASSTQNVVSSSSPPYTMPVPCIPLQTIPPPTSWHAEVNNNISSSDSGIKVNFMPIGAGHDLRYEDRPPLYVIAVLYHISG